jgi:gluconolactonase
MDTYEIYDDAFREFVDTTSEPEKISEGYVWAEGPVWFGDTGCLIWSDIPNDRMLQWVEGLGTREFRKPAGYSNGHTRDLQGRLVSCQHGFRSVTRTEYDGTVTTLADGYQGKRLNSPNDVVVKSDGTIWFTDPTYGILSDREGHAAESEIGACYVFRLDPSDGSLEVVADDFAMPNGLAFSPDESILYIADTGASHNQDGPRHIRAFDVVDGSRLENSRLFADCEYGLFDGFRIDEGGCLWTSSGAGVDCYSPEGTRLGRINLTAKVANVEFGGPDGSDLFVCASSAILRIRLNRRGVKYTG